MTTLGESVVDAISEVLIAQMQRRISQADAILAIAEIIRGVTGQHHKEN